MPDRDGYVVMLNQLDGISPRPNGEANWDAYFWCDDADALHAELAGRNTVIEYAPLDRPLYGMREFAVRDLDGHVLVFGSDK